MAPPKKRSLPKPLPDGFILTDNEKKQWRLGKIIGQGGFGLIYLASRDVDTPVAEDTEFVIKLEYQENGPLFSELKFYQRAAKPERMEKWKRQRKMGFLGIPTYWGTGQAEYHGLSYRFMAMDRLGTDLQKICDHSGGRLRKATVLQLGQILVDVLEYIHENEYVHADIKAANLMLGYRDHGRVYLADYGLSYRYCPDGVHKEYKENPKKGHNGTIEYTSIDAHKGLAPSRRGDLQILGFCLLHWLCGSLPWDNVLKNPTEVQEAKVRLMDHLPDSVVHLSVSGASTDELAEFLLYVKTLDYQDEPNYQHVKGILGNAATGRLDFSVPVQMSTSKAQDPKMREKQKAGRARERSKAKAVPVVEDDNDDDEEEKEKPKSKAVAANRRGRVSKAQAQQRDDACSPEAGRSLRPRPAVHYREDESEDEDGEEEEEEQEETTRPRPIPACYLRGPPIGPRAQSKQSTHLDYPLQRKTQSKRPSRKTKHLTSTSTSEGLETRLHPPRRHDTHAEDRGSCDGRLLHHRAGCSRPPCWDADLCCENGDSFSGWNKSAPCAPQQKQHGLFSWLVFAGVFLFLGAVFGVSQSAYKSL